MVGLDPKGDSSAQRTPSPSDQEDAAEPNNRFAMEQLMESIVRVTLAGFGASIVGLAHERQGGGDRTRGGITGAGADSYPNAKLRTRPPSRNRVPPTRLARTQKNLPLTWALSSMLFVGVLESCRLTSPTTILYETALPYFNFSDDERQISVAADKNEESTSFNYQKTAVTAFGDYTIGGSIAGLAGAWGSRRRQIPGVVRPPTAAFLGWGMGTGLVLGCIAGIFQAGVEVGNLYLSQQQQLQECEGTQDESSEES